MPARAQGYWASLMCGRGLPWIGDLDARTMSDVGPHSILLDLTIDADDPSIVFLGSALANECGVDTMDSRMSEAPAHTLLSRLHDPVSKVSTTGEAAEFEAEFMNARGVELWYRGVLMPFSAAEGRVSHIHGVINWKEVASDALTLDIHRAIGALLPGLVPMPPSAAIWA
ncbi:MAG: hypothetical protein ABW184_04770 [Sphingobium sp.]